MELAAASQYAIDLVKKINGAIVNPIVAIMFAAALVAFLWGVRGFITSADNPEARAKGAGQIMWGIIGMALMIMSFTIVRIVVQTFGFDKDQSTKDAIDTVLKNQEGQN